MCGIFGVSSKKQSLSGDKQISLLKELMLFSESRGKESAGLAYKYANDTEISLHKLPMRASEFLKEKTTKAFLSEYKRRIHESQPGVIIGHARMVTNGHQDVNTNNQPVQKSGFTIVHNGIFCNSDEVFAQHTHFTKHSDVDTEVLCDLLSEYKSLGVKEAVAKAYGVLEGAASLGILNEKNNLLIIASNNGSLYYYLKDDVFVFASEEYILKSALKAALDWDDVLPQHVQGHGVVFNMDSGSTENFPIQKHSLGKDQAITLPPVTFNSLGVLEYPFDEIRQLKRCSKCILPVTFPFINFDEKGECNYCRNYKSKHKQKDIKELFSAIESLKKPGAQYDCLVPFSGGRDSSYGLHYMVKEMGLNPLTYTYDWGMVTDLARRNISRMCAELEVENILVSADIPLKRENIRKNVVAWLKNPQMGIIPLFMAGDKSFLTYVNKIKKQTHIAVDVWMPNWLENTEFKTGYCGIKPKEKARIEDISLSSKFHLAWFYGVNFLKNPAYFNYSMVDSIAAFFAYYFEPRNNYYILYDFIGWDEKEVNKVLLGQYHWETASDSSSTWRIGDGTAGFYNYLYYTLGGFSEVDTFRSNQIREGALSRSEALRLAEVENQPRHENIQWYLNTLGLDFKSTIARINSFPRAYRELSQNKGSL